MSALPVFALARTKSLLFFTIRFNYISLRSKQVSLLIKALLITPITTSLLLKSNATFLSAR